ncbi:hypothetical protein HDU96_007592 [Phlyctochytrium bullatum]|nr:hypothetical protein HDU96_007592 [Phlyctochytrium bullatum]
MLHVTTDHDLPLQTQISASILLAIPETEASADLFGTRLSPTTHHLTLLAIVHTFPFLPALLTHPSPLLLATLTTLIIFSLLNALRLAYLDDELETARTRFYVSQGITVPCGMETASWPGLLVFSWVNALAREGSRKVLGMQDVPGLAAWDRAEVVVERVKRATGSSIWVKLFFAEGWELFVAMTLNLLSRLLSIARPILLYLLVGSVEDPATPPWILWRNVFLLTLDTFLLALAEGHSWYIQTRIEIRIRAAIADAIFAKSLTRAASVHPNTTTPDQVDLDDDAPKKKGKSSATKESAPPTTQGRIVALMSSDVERIWDSVFALVDATLIPVEISLAMALLLYLIGWPGLLAPLAMLLVFPLMNLLVRANKRSYEAIVAARDARIEQVREMLAAIRAVKLSSWEDLFLRRIGAARDGEMKAIVEFYVQSALQNLVLMVTPLLASFLTLVALAWARETFLDAKTAFACLFLFGAIKNPLMEFPSAIVSLVQMRVSMKRIQEFLDEPDLPGRRVDDGAEVDPDLDGFELSLKGASFCWGDPAPNDVQVDAEPSETSPLLSPTPSQPRPSFTLPDLTATFPRHRLTVICGRTGSGKTSLLLALLGEMPETPNSVRTRRTPLLSEWGGQVAYVAQTAWLRNATIRENVCFGMEWEEERYWEVVRACGLERDLEVLERGDGTLVGEHGINLSGGQKQRLSLARAIYSNAPYVLLDDPLSAVDGPTATHILHNAILKHLMRRDNRSGPARTVILVTNAVQLVLPHADHLLVLDGGRVVVEGPANAETVAVAVGHLPPDVLGRPEEEQEEEVVQPGSVDAVAKTTPAAKEGTDVTASPPGRTAETMATGSVDVRVYLAYLSAAGGWVLVVAFTVSIILERLMMVASDFWIREWTKDRSGNAGYYLGVFGGVSAAFSLFFLLRFGVLYAGSYRASKIMHDGLVRRIVGAPLKFFESNPSGRILNRIARDIASIDQNVMVHIRRNTFAIVEAVSIFAVVSSITPVFLLVLLPFFFLYAAICKRYLDSARALKRLESVTRSPIYSLFSEMLTGIITIRASKASHRFAREARQKVETNHRASLYLWTMNRWLQMRVTLMTAVITFAAAAAAVFGVSSGRGEGASGGWSARMVGVGLDQGLVAISLMWVMQSTKALTRIVRQGVRMEMEMNSVERVMEYSSLDQEQSTVLKPSASLPKDWPSAGAIEVRNLTLRYSPTDPSVLHRLSFTLPAGHKLGVVGRTGAGKSSLALALFRMLERDADPTSAILVDGIDVAAVELAELRSRLTMLPQDPVVFAGTVRENLDPGGLGVGDYEMWEVLKDLGFGETLGEGSGSALDMVVAEGGANFSVGQRQLLCLARAVLKKSKVLVLDEATASVDALTDQRIQQVLRSNDMANVTVIAIAHRLQTIIDYDLVLVLDQGQRVQFGPPLQLMDEEGPFRDLCLESGSSLAELRARASGTRQVQDVVLG